MKKTQLISLLIIVSLSLTLIPRVEAATDEWVTRTLDEDLFFAAYRFDNVDMVYLQGDNMRIISWLWFEGPVMQARRYIEEAYLSVKIASVGGTDPNALMTIYGKPSAKGGTPNYYVNPSAINGPYTTHAYEVNLSSFVNIGGWHNITVTNILREINQGYYFYDGHDIAFVTISTSDHDEERTIKSEESGNAAKLYIHYGVKPTPPEDETAMWIERLNGLDIYQSWGYENFYEDYTEVDPLGLIRTSEENPYRITFEDFGFEYFWDDLTYFRRDEDINATADTIESRFSATISDDDNIAYHKPDFYWIRINEGGHWIAVSHRGETPDHEMGWISDHGTVSMSITPIPTPIPPTKTRWYSMLWNYTDDRMTIKGFENQPTSNDEWINGFDSQFNKSGGSVSQERYYAYFAVRSMTGENWFDGWSDGWLENLIIIVDNVPVIDGTFLVVDPETNETLVTGLPDLNSTRDWIDIYQAGEGENPEDPNPGDEWGEGILSRFSFKLLIFLIGMVFMIGTPIYGFYARPEGQVWVLIAFSMFIGVALLWSLQTM